MNRFFDKMNIKLRCRAIILLFASLVLLGGTTWVASADTLQYIYDSLNRLIEVRYPDKVIRYTYDDAGNRTSTQVLAINPIPTLASLSPLNAIVGGAGFTLTINGTNFVNNATVKWNGADRPTMFVNSTQVTASITAADISATGTANITVTNPDPTNGASSALSFAINNPAPTITGINPASTQAGNSTTILTVNGTNFVNGTVARWNGSDRATSVANSTQLTMVVSAVDLAAPGSANITVNNPVPGGGTSGATGFTVSPCSGSLSPGSLSFNPNAATGSLSVITATGACAWTAVSNVPWVTVTAGNSGTGNGTVSYSIGANTGPARSGTVTIAGNTFTVTQSAVPLSINGVTPAAGRTSGGQPISLAGAFASLSSVTVGGVSATWSYTNGASDTSMITVTTPAHAVGAVNIDLTPTSGSPYTKPNAFAYLPTSFTDNVLVAGVTTARAQHIIELRTAIDSLRIVAGLGTAPWTDPTLSPTSTIIKAVHITELRTYLEQVAALLGYAAGSYTDAGLGSGLVIKRVHIEELRQRIRVIAG